VAKRPFLPRSEEEARAPPVNHNARVPAPPTTATEKQAQKARGEGIQDPRRTGQYGTIMRGCRASPTTAKEGREAGGQGVGPRECSMEPMSDDASESPG